MLYDYLSNCRVVFFSLFILPSRGTSQLWKVGPLIFNPRILSFVHQVLDVQPRAAYDIVGETLFPNLFRIELTNVAVSTLPARRLVRVDKLREGGDALEICIVLALIADADVDGIELLDVVLPSQYFLGASVRQRIRIKADTIPGLEHDPRGVIVTHICQLGYLIEVDPVIHWRDGRVVLDDKSTLIISFKLLLGRAVSQPQ